MFTYVSQIDEYDEITEADIEIISAKNEFFIGNSINILYPNTHNIVEVT